MLLTSFRIFVMSSLRGLDQIQNIYENLYLFIFNILTYIRTRRTEFHFTIVEV